MRTLLADDNGEIRAALRLLLEELGRPDMIEATDVGQTLIALEAGSVDLILLDWELPDAGRPVQDGPALVRELRRLAPDCRLIVMSCRPEVQQESLAAGCDGFVNRNDPPDRLLALLSEQ